MRVGNLAHQRPATAFSGAGWYLDTPLFQGPVGPAVDEHDPDAEDGHPKEEVLSSKRHEVGSCFEEHGGIFFPPSLPPWEGGERREFYLSSSGKYS